MKNHGLASNHHSSFLSNLANILTFFRILLVPCIAFLLISNNPFCDFLSAVCFFVAAITDYFDGYIARKFSAVSRIGEFLDPVADKLLVLNTFFLLGYRGFFSAFDISLVFIIISRDIFVSDLRDLVKFRVSQSAKFKTFFQMVALLILMSKLIIGYFYDANILNSNYYDFDFIYLLFRVFLASSAVFSLFSLINYLIYCFDSRRD
jgi:CDP-diacylglycerol--glycerol-3-phosphate 3-phosphatidyltransferase